MDAIRSFISPFTGSNSNAFPGYGHGGGYGGYSSMDNMLNGMKWVVLGGTVETARRLSGSAWNHFINSFFLTAHFSEDDMPYDWLMLWLSRRPEWQRSREFETTTKIATPGGFKASGIGEFGGDEDDEGTEHQENSDDDIPGRPKTRVVFQPTFDTTHTIYWRGHWLRVRRGHKTDEYNYRGSEMLSISVVARSNSILKQLVLQAKKGYEAEATHRVQIYFADQFGGWRWTDSRHKRPMSSIVLNPGVKEMLLGDAKDFLKSEKWYADRGIPFRRGYLLHGVPGSGKSSLIHAVAGELLLDIYVVSLSSSWISDATLTTLMGRVPARCILLLEDLDAAFTRSLTREKEEKKKKKKEKKDGAEGPENNPNGNNNSSGSGRRGRGRSNMTSDQMGELNTLSLSGLLNALDGVAASEGRLLFATTNHLDRLDPALSRPGRMDVWVEFKNASRWQGEALFRNFFPCCDTPAPPSIGRRSSSGTLVDPPSSPTSTAPLSDEFALSEDQEKELRDAGVVLPEVPLDVAEAAANVQPETSSSSQRSSRIFTPTEGESFWSSSASLVSGLSGFVNSGASVPSTPAKPAHSRTMSEASGSVRGKAKATGLGAAGIDLSALPQFGADNKAYLPPPVAAEILEAAHSAKPLDSATLGLLAKKFADSIPEDEFSVAALQGYLLKHKSKPEVAAQEAGAWVISEREMKERMAREKKEKEEKTKLKKEKRRKARAEKKARAAAKQAQETKPSSPDPAASAVTVVPAQTSSASSSPPPPTSSAPTLVAEQPQPVAVAPSPEESIVVVIDPNTGLTGSPRFVEREVSSPGESVIITSGTPPPPPAPVTLEATPPIKVVTLPDSSDSDSDSDDSSGSDDDSDSDSSSEDEAPRVKSKKSSLARPAPRRTSVPPLVSDPFGVTTWPLASTMPSWTSSGPGPVSGWSDV